MKNELGLALLAALLSAAQQPAPATGLGRTAWVFATIGHSRWCPGRGVRPGPPARRECAPRPRHRALCPDRAGGAAILPPPRAREAGRDGTARRGAARLPPRRL